jgi:methyl-accepting chemotaxis protein
MEFDSDKMVLAHSRWKSRLRNVVQSNEVIDIASSERDDQCDLGRWLVADGRQYEQLRAFQDLKAIHTRFHSSVGAALRKLQSCSPQEGTDMLDPVKSEFGRASSACINAIAALRQAIASAK